MSDERLPHEAVTAGSGTGRRPVADVVRSTRLPIPGTRNLRDLGGLPTRDGGQVRTRTVFRAEVLAAAEVHTHEAVRVAEASQAMRYLGVATVVDLRSEAEAERVPSLWAEATEADTVLSTPIAAGAAGTGTSIMKQLVAGELRRFSAADLGDFYRGLLDHYGPVFAHVVDVLAEAERRPLLVHCMAGKDRTGLFTALLLSCLGVERDAVVADYSLTGELRPDRIAPYVDRLAELGVPQDDVRAIFESPPEAMRIALQHLDDVHGGAVQYLSSAGLAPSRLEQVRAALVVPGAVPDAPLDRQPPTEPRRDL